MLWCLQNQQGVVVEVWQPGQTAGQAPLPETSLLGSIGAPPKRGVQRGYALARFEGRIGAAPTGRGQGGKTSIGRIDDQRCLSRHVSGGNPELVVPLEQDRVPFPRLSGVALPPLIGRRSFGQLFVREQLALAKGRRTLERRHDVVRPGPLQIGITPRRARLTSQRDT